MDDKKLKAVLDECFSLVEKFAGGPWPLSPVELLQALKGYDEERFFDQFEKGEIRRKTECGGLSYGT
jgi:hypothetical protein